MKKGGFLRNVLDTIRSNQNSGQAGKGNAGAASDRGLQFGGQLKPSHFALSQVARHGFPEHPTALAFDPVQKIAAIGTKTGAIRVFGRPGVDVWAQHEPASAVTHMKFIVNQGAIITVTADESIHLWSLRGPNLRLHFSTGGQSTSGASAACSPAPTPLSNISSTSPQSAATAGGGGGGGIGGIGSTNSSATTPSSFLGQITDTVTGAVDSASDFLSGAGVGVGGSSSGDHHHQPTPSPTGADLAARAYRQPELLHTLKFQREHITCIHQTLSSKWLYIGTDRGNVHIANVETFELSGYSIAWNKAIELSRKTHPGSIIHLSECPQDTNKLLIGYESGCIVIWDLKQRNADGRYYHTENLLWLAWHYEGKQFVAAHGDGSLITWLTRSNTKPAQILYPHAKTASSSAASSLPQQQQQQDSTFPLNSQQTTSLASSIARSLNNELYRPINKVEWKTSKSSNEQFLLFSGGLPYDNLDQVVQAHGDQTQLTGYVRNQGPVGPSQARLLPSMGSPALLKASPLSPSISPNLQQQQNDQSRPISATDRSQILTHKERRNLRSTSITVMYGKSITVLEMDDMIVDFLTVCDNSPYENDTSDPYAVIVLLSNELILIDLTSPGYPSFDSPYPSACLNESPVTCVQYLADCSTDLIPFLYSTSQNVISRAPKKGFSDKEWPINGGEWGQSMQSYPELVLTGHADGTIKFWDMSGINFDLISKIKTSKLFDRPQKLASPIYFTPSIASSGQANSSTTNNPTATRRPGPTNTSTTTPHSGSPFKLVGQQQQQHQQQSTEKDNPSISPPVSNASGTFVATSSNSSETNQTALDESLFAIEKIEFCSITKRLIVAGAFSQVILFKLNKKDPHGSSSAGGGDLTTILVEPTTPTRPSTGGGGNGVTAQHQTQANHQYKQHLLLRLRDSHTTTTTTGSTSGGSSSSAAAALAAKAGSHRAGGRGLSGFQAELICLTPLLLTNAQFIEEAPIDILGCIPASSSSSAAAASGTAPMPAPYFCQIPTKITALAFQATHNM